MNKFDCSEDIDLTNDNVDLFESLLGTKSRTDKFPKPLKTMPPDDSSSSVLETLRSIQRENPQVETIFLDSDEDDIDQNPSVQGVKGQITSVQTAKTNPPSIDQNISVQSVKPYTPSIGHNLSVQSVKTYPPSNNVNLHGNNRPECDPLKLPVPPLSNITQQANLRITTEIPPSAIPLQNANTIPMKSATKGSSAARFLVIPQEVLPILLASKGPVSLNIPGIGPLVIPKPSDILHAPRATLQVPVNPENVTSTVLPEKKPQKTTAQITVEPEYDPLCDPKYQCWRYRRRIKRDLDGFSLLDRLGFYKAEQQRSKACAYKCEENVKLLQYRIHMVKRKLDAIQESRLKSEKIGKTKDSADRHLKKHGRKITTQIKTKVLNPIQKKNLDAIISWQEHFQLPTKEPSSESDDNLLITKKVVILKDSKTRRRKRRKIKRTTLNTEDDSSSINSDIKKPNTKTVNTARAGLTSARITDRLVPKRIKRKPGRPRKSESLLKKNKFHKLKKDITPVSSNPTVKQKRGRPRKLRVKDASLLYDKEMAQMRSCHVQLSPVEIKPEVLERYETYKHKSEDLSDEFSPSVIDNLKWFQNEIDSDKPILVVNEVQCSTMNLRDMCHSNNIVFPVSQISDLSTNFLTFISSYNVKFAKPDILCHYLSGKRA